MTWQGALKPRIVGYSASRAAAKLAANFHSLPAQILHSQKVPHYLQLKQSDIKVLSPAQDDSSIDDSFIKDDNS
jgi:hypothetical protein